MSTHGTVERGFTAQCGQCKEWFDDEAEATAQALSKALVAAGWQIFPMCCAKCVAELNVKLSDVQQEIAVPAGKAAGKPTEKATGDDTGRVRRRMRRRLL